MLKSKFKPKPLDPIRLRTLLRLASARIQQLQNKLSASTPHSHRQVVDLLREGKIDRARLRVKHTIRDDFLAEALEMIFSYSDDLEKSIELLCTNDKELLKAQQQAAKTTAEQQSEQDEVEEELRQPIVCLIYSASRVDISELLTVKEMLLARYGQEWFDKHAVNEQYLDAKLVNKLSMKMPEKDLVERYLETIADAYGVHYNRPGDNGNGGKKEAVFDDEEEEQKQDEDLADLKNELAKQEASKNTFAALSVSGNTSSVPGSTRLPANYREQAKAIPGNNALAPPTSGTASTLPSPPKKATSTTAHKPGDFDDLAKRFEALKRR